MRNFRSLALTSALAGLIICMCASDVLAQRGGRRGGARRGGQNGGVQQLLRRDDVKKELELSDEQVEQLEELGRGGFDREAMREMREELEGMSEDERRDKVREMMEDRTKETQEKIDEILLPHQSERLSQLNVQYSTRNGARGILNGKIAEELKLTDKQKEGLEERAEELQKELAEKIEELRAEMQEELMEELTSDQRKKLEKMRGDGFKFQQQERGERDRGNRGGRDRGDRRGNRDADRTDF